MNAKKVFDKYVAGVISGKVITNQKVFAACKRHRKDIANSRKKSFAYKFDAKELQRSIDFCELCKHWKGEFAGQPFIPEPWQVFVFGSVRAWKHKTTGLRRFRAAYIELPRKNGKTFMAAVFGLAAFLLDNEPGAEIYTAATKKEQAKICHTDAKEIVSRSEFMKEMITVQRDNLHVMATSSKYEPLSADSETLDGLNVHVAVVDELHAHKTRALWDVLDSATGARRQPIMFAITTAGYNHNGICMEIRRYCELIIDAKSGVSDEQQFAYIAGPDPADDWQDEKTWKKANPNWGVSVRPENMREAAKKASKVKSAENNFRCKRLSEWVGQAERWIQLEKWDACPAEITDAMLTGPCYAGLDLANVIDVAALAFYWPESFAVRMYYWIPESKAVEKEERDRVPYRQWSDAGLVELTPGDVIDYAYIRKRINEYVGMYDVKTIAYDPYNATQIVIELQDQDGLPVAEFKQGILSMNAPCKELERMIVGAVLRHGGDPVLRWQVSNVAVKADAAGNIKMDKQRSAEKIDGAVALAMAVGASMAGGDHDSIYETRGIVTIGG